MHYPCLIGLHDWEYLHKGHNRLERRVCKKCHTRQELGYDGMGFDWYTTKETEEEYKQKEIDAVLNAI